MIGCSVICVDLPRLWADNSSVFVILRVRCDFVLTLLPMSSLVAAASNRPTDGPNLPTPRLLSCQPPASSQGTLMAWELKNFPVSNTCPPSAGTESRPVLVLQDRIVLG